MSNFIEGIAMAIVFLITCPILDHPIGHIISIPLDTMVSLLRIFIFTSFHQQ